MKNQETIASRIIKNVNKVLEVIPRTLNSDAEVIHINFRKPGKARRTLAVRKPAAKKRKTVKVKARAKTMAHKVKKVARKAKRSVKARVAAKRRAA